MARCVGAEGDVRFHPASETVWNPVEVGMGFSEGTWIQTAPAATAQIQILPDQSLQVESNSVVILSRDIQSKEDELVTVVVKRGRARLKKASGKVTTVLPQNEEKVVPEPISLQLLAPPPGKTVTSNRPLPVRWTPVPDAVGYRVQMAKTEDFKTLVADAISKDSTSSLTPSKPGSYYWRVQAETTSGPSALSVVRHFEARSDHLLSPDEGQQISAKNGNARVKFAWKPQEGAKAYELVVSQSPNLQQDVVLRQTTHTARFVSRSLKEGTYYWGAFSGTTPLFGEARKLVIKPAVKNLKLPRRLRWE